jgi:hypothetical protein
MQQLAGRATAICGDNPLRNENTEAQFLYHDRSVLGATKIFPHLTFITALVYFLPRSMETLVLHKTCTSCCPPGKTCWHASNSEATPKPQEGWLEVSVLSDDDVNLQKQIKLPKYQINFMDPNRIFVT